MLSELLLYFINKHYRLKGEKISFSFYRDANVWPKAGTSTPALGHIFIFIFQISTFHFINKHYRLKGKKILFSV